MKKRSLRSWFTLLCLLPFLAGSLVPLGFMPSVSSDGVLTLVICTPDGVHEKAFPTSEEDAEHTAEWCPFSQLSAPVFPPAPVQTAEIDWVIRIPIVGGERDVPALIDVANPQPRGPPAIV